MVEVLDFILEIFRVQNFASKYTNPLDQFLYALFFPSVIMVIFVVLLTEKMFEQRQGLKMLLTLSFFLFIVVYPPNATYSLYSIMAPILGTVWYLFVILIGFVFFLFSKILPKEGVGGVRGMAMKHIMAHEIEDANRLINEKKEAIRAYKKANDPKFLEVISGIDQQASALFNSVESSGDIALRARMLSKRKEFERLKFEGN